MIYSLLLAQTPNAELLIRYMQRLDRQIESNQPRKPQQTLNRNYHFLPESSL